jgi:hypothetical protein
MAVNNGAGTGLSLNVNSGVIAPSLANIGNAMRPAVTPLNAEYNFDWNEARRHYEAEPSFLITVPKPITFDEFVVRLSSVLGLSDADTRAVIENLNPAVQTTDFFTNMSARLPRLELGGHSSPTTIQFRKRLQTGNEINIIKRGVAGKGSFGEIFMSADGKRIYKTLRLTYVPSASETEERYFERKIREFFFEIFVQTLLSADKQYGGYVLPVKGTFRRVSSTPHTRVLIIQMPSLKKTLFDLLTETAARSRMPVRYIYIKHVLKSIAEVLLHFRNLYNFHHCDLHDNNIMYSDLNKRRPMIIDFGKSCLTFNGITYVSNPTEEVTCSSNDLLILLVSLLYDDDRHQNHGLGLMLDSFTRHTLIDALTCAKPEYDFYTVLKNNLGKKFPVSFRAVHPENMNPGKPVYEYFNKHGLLPLPHIDTIENFLTYLQNIDKTQIELAETPARRRELGAEMTNTIIKELRTPTMVFRRPLVRGQATRHLIGGGTHFLTKRRRSTMKRRRN